METEFILERNVTDVKRNYDSICCFRSRDSSIDKRVCWEITTDCNLGCEFCHRYDHLSEYYDVSDLEKTIEIFLENKITNVILSGGEPLLHPQFFEILKKLHSHNFSIDICTNGTLLTDENIKELRKYISEISVSLDSYTSIRHDSMRKTPGAFSKTCKNIDKLIECGFDVHITTVVDCEFASHIKQMTKYLYEKGIKSVAYLGLIPLDTGKNDLFEADCQHIIFEQISEVRKRYPDMAINTKQLLLKSGCVCGAGRYVFGMGVDGDVLHPCLLTRERSSKVRNDTSPGLCPGSRYLTQKGV